MIKIAAQAYASDGTQQDAFEAYLLAHELDESNAYALRGVVAQSSRNCCELQRKNTEQAAQIQVLTEMVSSLSARVSNARSSYFFQSGPHTFVWDISGDDFSRMSKGQQRKSPKFPLAGLDIQAWISYYPQGEERTRDGHFALFLCRDACCKVQYGAIFNFEEKVVRDIDELPWTPAGDGYGWVSVSREDQPHRKIRINIKAVQVEDSLTYRYD